MKIEEVQITKLAASRGPKHPNLSTKTMSGVEDLEKHNPSQGTTWFRRICNGNQIIISAFRKNSIRISLEDEP
jgi:hypothetical protein